MWKKAGKVAFTLAVFCIVWGYLNRGLQGRARLENRQSFTPAPAQIDDELSAVVAAVNQEFQVDWQNRGYTPAPEADWWTVCRRVSLAMIGCGLSVEELRLLEALPEELRVNSLVERLLADERFHDYWAERWARTYVSNEEGPFLVYRRRKFVHWLSEQLQSNRPYDQVVRELLEAKGFMTDQPAVNFVTLTTQGGVEEGQPDPIKLAARTSRAVLGTRIDCLQCHDDFLDEVQLGDPSQPRSGTQQDFHRLAAFFATARINGLQGIRDEQDRKYEYKFLHEDETVVVEPQVPFLPQLLSSEGSPRRRLAAWATHRENLPAMRAAVGRVWALLFGKPITHAVDDIPLQGHLPPGLNCLAEDFAEHGFNLQRLVRIITRLRTFRLDSRSPQGITSDQEQAWGAFPLVPLRPEQVAGSIVQACRLTTLDRNTAAVLQLQAFGEQNDFVKRHGDTGEDEFKQDAVTITQRLLVMNGELVDERTRDNFILNASTHIAMFSPEPKDAVNTTFLAVFNRLPREAELTRFTNLVTEAPTVKSGIEDLYWVLLNSTEFAWNH
jgi:hypothetical protein